jgi:hypothetical protein
MTRADRRRASRCSMTSAEQTDAGFFAHAVKEKSRAFSTQFGALEGAAVFAWVLCATAGCGSEASTQRAGDTDVLGEASLGTYDSFHPWTSECRNPHGQVTIVVRNVCDETLYVRGDEPFTLSELRGGVRTHFDAKLLCMYSCLDCSSKKNCSACPPAVHAIPPGASWTTVWEGIRHTFDLYECEDPPYPSALWPTCAGEFCANAGTYRVSVAYSAVATASFNQERYPACRGVKVPTFLPSKHVRYAVAEFVFPDSKEVEVTIPVPCQPDCTGKVCGDDGCGGSCGKCPVECAAHEQCAGDELCLGVPEEWVPMPICGLCGDLKPCQCTVPSWPPQYACASNADCEQGLPCGDQCDDCPDCPKCVHGWCAHETFKEELCLCTSCA